MCAERACLSREDVLPVSPLATVPQAAPGSSIVAQRKLAQRLWRLPACVWTPAWIPQALWPYLTSESHISSLWRVVSITKCHHEDWVSSYLSWEQCWAAGAIYMPARKTERQTETETERQAGACALLARVGCGFWLPCSVPGWLAQLAPSLHLRPPICQTGLDCMML